MPGEFSAARYEQMPYRRCGRSGLRLPPISLGAWETFGGYRGEDGAELGFVVADEIHFVDGDEDVAHTEKRCDVGMTPRLDQDAFACVDEHDGSIGCGCAGGHVTRVLLVARSIRDDEFAARGGEVAIGDARHEGHR